ncbi:MAG: DNA polymerase III subunit gamma and tau [Ornithinimicrobium sp.]
MSTALYRRYRPETFADVIGQEHVTEPLMQALRSERVNHAYLFSGPRGCGKTTSARILARCLNCEQGPTDQPCGVCDSCVALARGGSGTIDVVEIDAASHGGVDDARELRERAAFGPAQARYKVYIIDEAHMVTPHGFNALLKVVEEPPEHVKFIFATTEPEKVLSTIRSRTHHYPFHLVPPQRLTAYLEQVCQSEAVDIEPGVLSFVTRAGGGSVRDSLSVLDQLISGAGEAGLTYEGTASLLGFTDTELLDAVVVAVGAGDAASVFTHVDKVMESGHDPRRFVEDLLERYRDLIVLLAVGDRGGGLLPGAPQDQIERMQQQARSHGAAALTRCADVVSHGLAEMTGAVSYRLLLELICARLLLPGAAGEQGYGARLDRIERRLTVANQPPSPGASAPPGPSPRPTPASTPAPVPAPTHSSSRSTASEPQRPSSEPPLQEPPEDEPDGSDAGRAEIQPGVGPLSSEHGDSAQGDSEQGDSEQGNSAQGDSASEVSAPAASEQSPSGAGVLDTDAIRRSWPEVLDKVKSMRRVTWSFVSVNTKIVDFDGRRLLLQIGTAGQAETFRRGNHAEVVRQALIEAIGVDTVVESTVSGANDGAGPAQRRPRTRNEPATEPAAGSALAAEDRDRGPAHERSSRGQRGGSVPSAGQERSWSQTGDVGPPAWAQAVSPAQGAQEAPPVAAAEAVAGAPSGRSGGDIPAQDDDDLENSTTVGQSVIESVLGGKVISIDDPTQR